MTNRFAGASRSSHRFDPSHSQHHLAPPPTAQTPARSLHNDDYDPFEMRSEDEIGSPPFQYPQPSPPRPTVPKELWTSSKEIPGPETPAPPASHEKGSLTAQAREKVSRNLLRRYGGKWTLYRFHRVFLPRPPPNSDPEALAQTQAHQYDEAQTWDDIKGEVVKNTEGLYEYRNEFHEIDHKYVDTAVYLSPTNYVPRRLVVQAAGHVLRDVAAGADTGDWIRTRIRGSVPLVVTMSEWALAPLQRGHWYRKVDGALRVLLVSIPVQLMLTMPWVYSEIDDPAIVDSYTDNPGYHWDWPKYAINVLDEAPGPDGRPRRRSQPQRALDSRRRARGPQKVVIYVDKTDEWVLCDAADHRATRYVFISYSWDQFQTKDARGNVVKDGARIRRMAQDITRQKGFGAYWLDEQCMSALAAGQTRSAALDYDVYTMCDVVRGSALVAILLGQDSQQARHGWGARLWTLPEGMLAPGDTLTWCHQQADGTLHYDDVHKIEMTSTFWTPPASPSNLLPHGDQEDDLDGQDDWPVRTLAEHFSGVLPLTRLELLPSIINALHAQGWNNVNKGHSDLAYAVMGFLNHRIERNEDDTLFQSLARLSLGNDSDHIIERMISILPYPEARDQHKLEHEVDNSDLFSGLLYPDQFRTRLHDINPICDVVGVAHEDDTVIIDNCRAIHIRWKDFPRIQAQRRDGMRKLLASFFVVAGLYWLQWGLSLTFNWLPFWATSADGTSADGQNISHKEALWLEWIVCSFLAVAVLLSTAAPFSVRRLFGGQIEKSTPAFVAFEGTLPLCEIEKIVFGNASGRLTWAPSATPLSALPGTRHPRERQGYEPDWVTHPERQRTSLQGLVPPNHHLFTLVDTGDLTVTVFTAERPPTVALMCGREGGMVRAALCSWRFENDCLYKETVIRLPSTVSESATPKDWLKLCLLSQDRAKEKRARIMAGVAQASGVPAAGRG